MTRPAGIRVERIATPAVAPHYREKERAGPEAVRITYRPPRFEALWVLLSIGLGLGLLVGFVAWLGASAGVDLVPDHWPGPPLLVAGCAASLAALGIGVIVLVGWPRPVTTVELAVDVLRCEGDRAVERGAIVELSVEGIEPPRGRELSATNWIVVARTRDAVVTVMSGLPTRAHAADVCAALEQALRPAG